MGFGWGEILLILLLVLILFGAKRIPEIARAFGKGVQEFKKGMNDITGGETGGKEKVKEDEKNKKKK